MYQRGHENDNEEEDKADLISENVVGSVNDPFVAMFNADLPQELKCVAERRPQPLKMDDIESKVLGKMTASSLSWDYRTAVKSGKSKTFKLLDDEGDEGHCESVASKLELLRRPLSLSQDQQFSKQFVKESLIKNLRAVEPNLSSLTLEAFQVLNTYRDWTYCHRTHSNGEKLRLAYILHTLNHVLKTRAKILLNNDRLSKRQKKEEGGEEGDGLQARDQGLCRPKVLLVTPFRESARRIVHLIVTLLFGKEHKGRVAHSDRFVQEFGDLTSVNQFEEEEETAGSKPEDYYKTFTGNTDDSFRLGMAVTKKTLKLYTGKIYRLIHKSMHQ